MCFKKVPGMLIGDGTRRENVMYVMEVSVYKVCVATV